MQNLRFNELFEITNTCGQNIGLTYLHPDFNRVKMPSGGKEPDELDGSNPNRQIICNNRLGFILISF